MSKRCYLGSGGLSGYLSPSRNDYIPLVELPESLNPYLQSHGIRLSAKLMNTLPLGNVKSLPAHSLLASKQSVGKNIVESSSGNTVMSMGLLAESMNLRSVTAVASADVSPGKLKLLRLANINVRLIDGPICPDANDPAGSIAIARQMGLQNNWINPGQYDNDANPRAHETITGPQLVDQLGDSLAMFVAGLGTTGTLVGTARYLRSRLSGVMIGGVVRIPNNKVPGVRTRNGLREVAFDWQDALTEDPVYIDEVRSYDASLRLIRSGLLVGPSSGFAYQGALDLIQQTIDSGREDSLRNKQVVFICPDSCFPYLDEYFEVLGEDRFPAIDNRSNGNNNSINVNTDIKEVSVDELYSAMNSDTQQAYSVIDVRSQVEYGDHHIPNSERVDFENIEGWLNELRGDDLRRRYLFVCARSARSMRAAHAAHNFGLDAQFLTGGTAAWSSAGYDRVQPKACVNLER